MYPAVAGMTEPVPWAVVLESLYLEPSRLRAAHEPACLCALCVLCG
jgi:hypothetical protein